MNDIGLEEAGVAFDRASRRRRSTAHMRTSVPHIYAVGDVAGRFQLAHTSFREGEMAAENALGHDVEIDYSAVPRCVYTDPEVAAVGPDRGSRRASATTRSPSASSRSRPRPGRRCTARRRAG